MEAKLIVSFIVVMVLAGLAVIVKLSPVVGAFAAGLLMHESYFKTWADRHHTEHRIKELFAPLEVIILPVFFVLLGIQGKLELLFDWQVAYVTLALIAVALLGKWLSGLGAGKNISRQTVGVGMMPRGLVGLAFAFIGKSLGVIDSTLFSALVVVIIATTIVAPLLLKQLVAKDTQAATPDDSTHASP